MTTEKTKSLVFANDSIPRDAFSARGSLADWVAMLRGFNAPECHTTALTARFCVYAGFASAALEPLGLRPFIIHLHGDTSKGKTTALKVVASIYGKPEEGKALIRWHGTFNGMMRRAEILKSIPLIIDDMSGDAKKHYSDLIYTVEGGVSKLKASKEDPMNTVKMRTWRLGLFTSGEPPLLSESALGGEAVRVWEFAGSPFGEDQPELIRTIEQTIAHNYGVGVRAFIPQLIKSRDMLEKELSGYRGAAWVAGDANGYTPVERRMLKSLNAIFAVGVIANKLFNLGWDVAEDMAAIFELIRKPVQEKIRTVDNISEFLRGYVDSHPVEFPAIEPLPGGGNTVKYKGGHAPGGSGIKGFLINDGVDLGIISTQFSVLMDELFAPGRSLWARNLLAEKGVIYDNPESKHRGRRQIRVDGRRKSLVYFENFFDMDDDFDEETGEEKNGKNLF